MSKSLAQRYRQGTTNYRQETYRFFNLLDACITKMDIRIFINLKGDISICSTLKFNVPVIGYNLWLNTLKRNQHKDNCVCSVFLMVLKKELQKVKSETAQFKIPVSTQRCIDVHNIQKKLNNPQRPNVMCKQG